MNTLVTADKTSSRMHSNSVFKSRKGNSGFGPGNGVGLENGSVVGVIEQGLRAEARYLLEISLVTVNPTLHFTEGKGSSEF